MRWFVVKGGIMTKKEKTKKDEEKKFHAMISKEMGQAINKFLADGTIQEDLVKLSPDALLERLGYKLNKKQKARLKGITMNELLDIAYTELGKVDKRFLQAKTESPSQKGSFPAIPIELAIPFAGVVIVAIVGCVVIKVGIDIANPDGLKIEDPNENKKI
jgi:hypothetical protein